MNPPTQNLRQAIDESAGMAAHKKLLETHRGKIEKHTFQVTATLQDVRELQALWKKHFEQFEHLVQRVAGCREALASAKEKVEFRRNHFYGYCGAQFGTNLQYLEASKEVGALLNAIPVIEGALAHNEKLLAEHKQQMLEFGRQNGIGEEILSQLEVG